MRMVHAILIFFIGLFLLLVAVAQAPATEVTCEVGCRVEWSGACNANPCSPGRIFVGYYDDFTSVKAAIDEVATCSMGAGTGTNLAASGSCPTVIRSSTWQMAVGSLRTKSQLPACTEDNCTYNWTIYGFYYGGSNPGTDYSVDSDGDGVNDNIDECPNTGSGVEVDAVGCPLDTDEDGIPDGIDPYPNDSDPFIYQLMGYQKDSEGNITFLCIKTHKGDNFCYGTFDSNEPISISTGGEYHDSSELAELTEDNEITDTRALIEDYEVPTLEPMETLNFDDGEDNTGNSVETDYLADIVTNTKEALGNQANIGNYLNEIANDIKAQNKILLDSKNNIPVINLPEAGESGASAADIGSAIGDELEARDTEGEQTTTDALDSIGEGNETFVGEFEESDKPEENLISSIYTDFKNNNPVSSIINGSGVEVSNSTCSFSWDYKGTSIPFSICNFEDEISMVGTILFGLAGIGSLLIVFRR